jgi:hypothetical protein
MLPGAQGFRSIAVCGKDHGNTPALSIVLYRSWLPQAVQHRFFSLHPITRVQENPAAKRSNYSSLSLWPRIV